MSNLILFDNGFGKLIKSNGDDYWEGEYDFTANHKIRIIVEMADEKKDFPSKFQNFIDYARQQDKNFRLVAASNLLELYNDTWRESENSVISENEFAERININSISFDEEKDYVSVYYDDADLFAGHEIKVDVSFDGTVLKANLP
jgi:hypothetical protein